MRAPSMGRPATISTSCDAPLSPAEGGAPIYDVLVIGGGASGLAAAITASRAGARTCILERDVETGLSILATGNGRCNVSNSRLDTRRYRHPDTARKIFGTAPERDVATFLESTGIATAEEGEGRLYPMSRRADSVRDALLNTCRREGITVMACAEPKRHSTGPTGLHEFTVDQARLPLSHKPGRDEKARIRNARKALAAADRLDRKVLARAVVLACGGTSGASCEILNLPHVAEAPVLCPIACTLPPSGDDETGGRNLLQGLDGLRVDCMLTLMRDGAAVAFEQGEVLFRPYGISGIAAFNLSRRIEAGDQIELDLFPEMNEQSLARFLARRAETIGTFDGSPRWFDGLLARPLAALACDAVAGTERPLNRAASMLHRIPLRVAGTTEHAQAQVRRGGVPLSAMELDTLAVHPINANENAPQALIYACGEAIDMDADCGGYNLAWAWLTGVRAGAAAAAAVTHRHGTSDLSKEPHA